MILQSTWWRQAETIVRQRTVHTSGQMDALLNRAEKKVREEDMRMVEYVGALSTGGINAR